MNQLRKFLINRKLAIAVCAVLVCAAIAAGFFLVLGGVYISDGEQVAVADKRVHSAMYEVECAAQNTRIVGSGAAGYGEEDNPAAVRLDLTAALKASTYIYGDNGYVGGKNVYNQANGVKDDDFIDVVAVNADSEIFDSQTHTIAYTYYSVDSLSVEMPEGVKGETYGNLVNGLPADTGKYGVCISIDFEDDNYADIALWATFEVTPRQLFVAVGNVSAVYGDALDLSQASMTVISGKLVDGETVSDLNVSLDIDDEYKVTEGKYFEGSYPLIACCGNANYSVVFGSGIYTVKPLEIAIELSVTNGIFGGKAPSVQVTEVVTADGSPLSEITEIAEPEFIFKYYGTSNDGKWNYSELNAQSDVPLLAGMYIVKAVTVTSDFNLTSNAAVAFTIEKQTIDASVITTRTEYYSGEPIVPYVNDNRFSHLYTVRETEYTDAGTWDVTLVLKDFNNYKWLSVDVAERVIPFVIKKGENSFFKNADGSEITIAGWTFGQSAHSPVAVGRFGDPSEFIYEYSDAEDGNYNTGVPATAGTWWVRVTAPQSDNYERATSTPVAFEIAKAPLSAPSLSVVTDGGGQNVVYTGSLLEASVTGFDPSSMHIIYSGSISSEDDKLTIFAVNAGTYKVQFALNDSENYRWADGVELEDDNALVEWEIARKKLEKPVSDEKMYMVNGGLLTYMPAGFDENTMIITGNKTRYGGLFNVTVSLRDTVNYEWADSSVEDITFDWMVVGWDTVFIIVVSVLGVLAGISVLAICVQYILHLRKKNREIMLEEEELLKGEAPAANESTAEENSKSSSKHKRRNK